jgi:antitoxin component YwqK of YwqJK toxin-antitoxin module
MRKIIGIIAVMATFTINAQRQEPVYKIDGERVKVTLYHENGNIAQSGSYLNGKLDGEWIMFDTSGEKLAIGHYADGKRQGKWFFWQQDGLKEVDFTNNQVAQVVKWNNSEAVVLNK